MPDGSEYEGQWKDDVFHGNGTLTVPREGIVFKGEFENGKQALYGKLIF